MNQAVRVGSVAGLACVGVFVTLACLIALNFEVSGFGRRADEPLQVSYVAALVVGALAGVGVPTLAALLLLGPSHRVAVAVGGAVALVGLLAFLGLRIF